MRLVVSLIVSCLVFSASLAFASDSSLASRVTVLEDALGQGFLQSVEFSGAIEVEGAYERDYDSVRTSDINIATVELGIDAILTDYFSGFTLLSWDDEEDYITVDEAGITLGSVEDYGVSATVGRLYVPFGVYETGMLSDPLTLELGEVAADGAIVVDFGVGGFYGATYAFNGETDDNVDADDDDMIDSYGVAAGYAFESEVVSVDVSAGWINNIAASAGFDDLTGGDIDDYTSGATASLVANVADFSFIAEYLTALNDDYLDSEDDKPMAWGVEVGYGFEVAGHGASVAAIYQQSDEAVSLGLAEKRYGAAFGFDIVEGLGATLEYVRDEDYGTSDGGTGDDADKFTCQLALEF